MSKHAHHHCDHDVKWCRDCDECYCTKCSAVWPKPCTQSHYLTPWWNPGAITYRTSDMFQLQPLEVPSTKTPQLEKLTITCNHGGL